MVGCSVFVIFVLAVAALAVAFRAQRRSERLEREVLELRRFMFAAERSAPAAAEAMQAPATPVEAPPPPPTPVITYEAPSLEPAAAPPSPLTPPPPVAPPRPPRPAFDWEGLIGVRLFSWIAGIALVLAMIFLLKYGVEHGWLRPAVRATIGLVSGIALLIACELKVARKYPFTANAMDGAGIAILYATLFALHGVWHLWPAWAAFAGMLVVTAITVWLSSRRDSVFIALLGLLGGFATPALLSSGENRPIALFSYLLLLNGGLSWIAYRKRWPLLTALSVALTAIYQWAWIEKFLNKDQLPLAAAIFAVFAILASSALWAKRGERPFERTATVGAALPLLFAFFTAIVPEYGARYNVLFGFLLLVSLGLAAIAMWRGPEWLHTLGGGATIVTFFIWLTSSYTTAAWPNGLLWLAAFVVLYLAVAMRLKTLAVYTSGILFFVLIGVMIHEPDGYVLQLVALFALLLLVAAYSVRYTNLVLLLIATVLAAVLVGGMNDAPAAMRLAAVLGIAAVSIGAMAIRPALYPAAFTALFLGEIVTMIIGSATVPPSFGALVATHGVLLAAILGVAWTTERHVLVPISVLFTLFAVLINDPAAPGQQLAFGFVHYVLYIAYALLLGARVKRALSPHLAAALGSAVFFVSANDALDDLGFHDVIGLLPLALAAVMVLLLWRLLKLGEEQQTRLAVVAGAALAFITVAIPLQFEKEWITIAWALEAAALAWLFRRIPHKGLLIWSAGLAAAVMGRLVMNPDVFQYHPKSATPVVNWYLYTYLISAVALYVTAWLFPPPKEWRGLLAGGATLLLFVLVNIEIADFYSKGDVLTFNFLSSSLAQDLTYTMGWALFAIALLITGIALRMRAARIAALVLLVVTILKCFLHDLGRLGGLYRVGSLFGLAVSLVLVGILLQKFVLARQPVTE
jgi:uncharacterized membrane protein